MPVYKDKKGKYMFKCSVHCKQFLRRGFSSREEAKQKEALFISTGSIGTCPMFNDLLDAFLSFYRNRVKESTYCTVKRKVNTSIRGYIPNVSVDKLCNGDFYTWRESIRSHSQGVCQHLFNYLGLIFDYCRDFYGYDCKPFRLLPPIKDYSIQKTFSKRKILAEDDFSSFLSCIESEKEYLLFLTAYITGLRIGEVRGLLVSCFDGSRIYVYQQVNSKMDKGVPVLTSLKSESSRRIIRLPLFLSSMLSRYCSEMKKNWFLFPSSHSSLMPIGETTINRIITDTCLKAGIERFNFHMLRHTEATLLVDSGFDKKVVAGLLGHSSSKVTEKYYLHTDESDGDKIIQVQDELFRKFKKDFH